MSRYALLRESNQAVFIENVQRGLKCGCYCAKCGEDLMAVQGAVYTWHFRHQSDTSDCTGSGETVLHQRAKEILKNGSNIMTVEKGEISYTNAVLELTLMDKYRPDVTAVHMGVPIYFEVAVHHPMEEDKLKYLRVCGFRFVEINLAHWIGQEPTQEELQYAVLMDVENKKVFWGNPNLVVSEKSVNGSSLQGYIKAALVFLFGWVVYNVIRSNNNGVSRKRRK